MPKIDIDEYMKASAEAFKDLDKDYPVLWRYLLKKRYILPTYRQSDYYPQRLCDYIAIDAFLSYLAGKISLKDHVSAHIMNSIVSSMYFDRPTLWLEKELGFPLMKTKLSDDFYLTDIHWRWPAFRVYLPKGLLTITRDGVEESMMYIDLTRIEGQHKMDLPPDLLQELERKFGRRNFGKIPILYSQYEGMSVTGIMQMDGPTGPVGYAASAKLDVKTVATIVDQLADHIESPVASDELDAVFMNKMLGVGLNILMFMNSLPAEYTRTEEVLRKPSWDGKRQNAGLYAAKFVGQSQFRTEHVYEGGRETGRHLTPHWRSGHWKRQPYGMGRKDRKLIWVEIYKTHEHDLIGETPV
jgi:hypothetical protein